MEKDKMITITQNEYGKLLNAYYKLNALECAGVDNWEGYGYALENFNEDEDEE